MGQRPSCPGGRPRADRCEGEHLSVAAASPRYMLAMKLLASRAERDQDDIRALHEMCGFTSDEEGLDLVQRVYPTHVIAPRVQFLLEEMFPSSHEMAPGSTARWKGWAGTRDVRTDRRLRQSNALLHPCNSVTRDGAGHEGRTFTRSHAIGA